MALLTLSKTDKASYLPIWDFPSFVLDKKPYYDVLDRTVKETIKDNPNTSASTLWEVMKCNIWVATDRFQKSLRSREREKLQVLNRQLNEHEEKRDTITPEVCTQLLSQIEKLQNYYSVTQADMTDKIIHKRIALFYEKSKTVSKYFLLFGRKHPRNHIHSLFNKQCALLTEN